MDTARFLIYEVINFFLESLRKSGKVKLILASLSSFKIQLKIVTVGTVGVPTREKRVYRPFWANSRA